MLKLRRYLSGHVAECVLAPTLKMLEALLQLIVPLVMAQIIDTGIPAADSAYILRRAALLVVMALAAYGVAVAAQYFCARLAAAFGTALRDDLFAHVMSLSREDVERLGTASLTTRITNDTQVVQDNVNMFFRLVLRSPFVTAGALVSALLVDGPEAAILAASVAVGFTLLMAFLRMTSRRFRAIQRSLDGVLLLTTENLEGTRVVRAFRQERAERDGFSAAATEVRDLQVSTGDLSALVNPLTYVALNLGLVALLWVGGVRVDAGALTQGQLFALASYVTQILVELVKLANLVIQLGRAEACAQRINEVFDTVPSQDRGTGRAEVTDGCALAFEDVSFTYAGGAGPALDHVSFRVAPGQSLGVIGGTGSGKSTLAALALRFYDATSGRVLVGERDVRELDAQSLRQTVSLVEQNPRLFSGTIASNLRWGAGAGASEQDLSRAVATAQATDVVSSKEGGLDAVVEQFGRNFSGGQRQRLAVARTLSRRPQVLVLDDASSALDFATDAALRRAIAHDHAQAAVVTISQRVGTVRACDQILVLEGGRQVGLGTHEELVRDCAVYREICESQLTEEEVAR